MRTRILLAVAMSCSSAWAAFKTEPIPEGISMGVGGIYCRTGLAKPAFDKEPEYKGEAQYGQVRIQGKRLKFVVFSSTGAEEKDTMIVDLNENGDLTDDMRIAVGTPATVCVPGGKPIKLTLKKPDGDRPGFYVLDRAEWHRGRIKLGDKEYEAALLDMELDGYTLGQADALIVDLNGDGEFKFDVESYIMEGATPLAKRVVLAGDTWDLTLDADAPDVKLSRYAGDCGRLATELRLGAAPENCAVMGFVMSKDAPIIISSPDGPAAARVPAGSYEHSMFMVVQRKDGKPSAQLQYSSDEPIVVEKDKTCTVTLGKPGEMDVTAVQEGNTLRIGQALKTGGSAKLGSAQVADENGKLHRPDPPAVQIRSPETGELIAEGKMQYG